MPAAELEVREGDAPGELHGAVVPEELLDGVHGQARVGAERLVGGPVAQEREGAVPDQVDRCLVPGDVEQHDLVEELALGQLVAFLLRPDQGREEIVGRVLPLPRHDLAHVLLDEIGGRQGVLDVGRRDDRVERARQGVGSLSDLVALTLGHPQQLTDHGERQWVGEVGDHVHRRFRRHGVERLVDELLDPGPQALDPLRSERLGDEAAQSRVVGRV